MTPAIKKALSFAIFSLASFAHAQNSGVGNGGDSVVCRNSKGKILSAEILDYYEGKQLRRLQFDYSASDYGSVVHEKLSDLARLDPILTRKLRPTADFLVRALKKFDATEVDDPQEVLFTSDILEDIPDSNHLAFPANCKVEQLAIRFKKDFDLDPSFIIQRNIWKMLTPMDKAGLILHETIYKEFVELGHMVSKKARFFNEMLSSGALGKMNFAQYLELAKNAGIPMVMKGDVPLLTNPILPHPDKGYYTVKHGLYQSYPSGYTKGLYKYLVLDQSGKISEERTVKVNPRKVHFKTEFFFHSDRYPLSKETEVKAQVFVNGIEVCQDSFTLPKRIDKYIAPQLQCNFELTDGSYAYKVVISTNYRIARVNYMWMKSSGSWEHFKPNTKQTLDYEERYFIADSKAQTGEPAIYNGRFLIH